MKPLEGSAAVVVTALVVIACAAAFPEERVADAVANVAEFVAAVAWLFWMFRARKNLDVLVPDVVFMRPALVVVWWFVPLASALLPLQAMREIVEASKAASTSRPYWTVNSPWWVGVWWVCFLGASLVDAIANRSVFVVDAISAAFAIHVVVRVTLWQRGQKKSSPSLGSPS